MKIITNSNNNNLKEAEATQKAENNHDHIISITSTFRKIGKRFYTWNKNKIQKQQREPWEWGKVLHCKFIVKIQ